MSLPLLHSPGDVVRWLLVRHGLGVDPTASPTANWATYSPTEPSRPDNCLTVQTTQGVSSGRIQVTGEDTPRYGVQVRVRAADHPTGVAKAHALRKWALEDVYLETLSLTGPTAVYTVSSFVRVGQVLDLGKMKPDSRLSLFTLNLQVLIDRES